MVVCHIDDEMQQIIDTRGFFVRHGRHRRAALLPVAPSPEVHDVDSADSDSVVEDGVQQRHRQRRDTDHNRVR